jgi:hypothetical protein
MDINLSSLSKAVLDPYQMAVPAIGALTVCDIAHRERGEI